MKNDPALKLGISLSSSCDWAPMWFGSYTACVHAWRFINPDWEDHLAGISFMLAIDKGMVFG
jgi:hypothetical protein